MAKQWLQERWAVLLPLLERGTEEEIAQACAAEIANWRERPQMQSASSLKKPMTDTRNAIRALPLTPERSWVNPRTRQREHLALKYLNFSEQEWAAMNAPSEARQQQREEDVKLLDHPQAIVDKAAELLKSERWEEIAVGLAVVTGRRLSEVLKVGQFSPRTRYTIDFAGQLKRKDAALKPYEIPTLVEAELVLAAWRRLRVLLDCSGIETQQISVKYGPWCVDAAQKHFVDLVPAREGGDLYTHLFRAVYGCIAVYFYCPTWVMDLTYMAAVQGHYWVTKADGMERRNYASTMHYYDYRVGDGQGGIDKQQGIKLGEPGVEVLHEFKKSEGEQTEMAKQTKQHKASDDALELERKSRTGFSMYKPKQVTKARLDQIGEEIASHSHDETLSRLADEHYELAQMVALLAPVVGQLQAASPLDALRALLSGKSDARLVDTFFEPWHTTLKEVSDVLTAAAAKDEEHPVTYLQNLVAQREKFNASLRERHSDKDYSALPLSQLRRIKTPEAAVERFRRAVDAIIAYNASLEEARRDARWYVNAAVVNELVGGRHADIAAYLETRKAEIDKHHEQYKLTPGYNRRSVPITERVIIADAPIADASEEPEGEEKTEQAEGNE